MAPAPEPTSVVAAHEIAKALNQALESPLKEVGNYIADKIRYLRYKSLLKIVASAKAEAEARGMLLQMPPLKFFVPFCEGASLEEEEGNDSEKLNDLQEMWKRLLITASEAYDSRHQVFVRILSEITINEVNFLKRMIDNPRATTSSRFSSRFYSEATLFDPADVVRLCAEVRTLGDSEIARLIVECLECPGVLFYVVCTGHGRP